VSGLLAARCRESRLAPEHANTGVLLLHGLTGMPSEMRPLDRALTQLGCTVEVPLLPGHGATHRELLATGWSDWLGGARRAADGLAARCDTLVVAGLSMGALLATLLAADRRHRAAVADAPL
jgi:carboxylesterase